MSTQHNSTVKWFDAKKGYGFIDHPDGEDDVFVHYSQIESERDFKTLRTGQAVEFKLNDGPKGLHAVNVVPTEEAREEKEEVVLTNVSASTPQELEAEPAPAASAEVPASSSAPPPAGNGQAL